MPCYDPSTGAVIALAPQCTAAEVEECIQAAVEAFPAWRDTPVSKRVQVLFKMKTLLEKHLDELTYLCAQENGKKWDEAMGDVLKVIEVVEFACGAPAPDEGRIADERVLGIRHGPLQRADGRLRGHRAVEFPGHDSAGLDGSHLRRPGNCMVLKAASFAPQCAMRITELWTEAGLPPGVLGIVTTSRNEAEIFLTHPAIKGVSFVGSTSVGLHIYSHRRRERQAGAGADGSQEPRAGAGGLRAGTHRRRASSIHSAAAPASAAWRCRWSP